MNRRFTSRLCLKHVVKGIFLVLILTACNDNRWDVELEQQSEPIEWKRLDQDFFAMKGRDIESVNDSLSAEYGEFYTRYLVNILGLGHPTDPAIAFPVDDYLHDEYIQKLNKAIQDKFSSVDPYHKKISKAYTYYHHHFPEKYIPNVVSFVGGFSYNAAVTDSTLGVGLDMYLGFDHEIYEKVPLPRYRVERMNAEYLPYDALRGWVLSEFGDPKKQNNILSKMIEYGKGLVVMDAVFPKAPDHLKIGFTKEQLEWCENSEFSIWGKMMDQNVLYSNEKEAVRTYLSEGPFTPGMPRESPGRVGYWVGWQIARSFIDEHPDMTLKEFMKLDNYQMILQKSKYKPKK